MRDAQRLTSETSPDLVMVDQDDGRETQLKKKSVALPNTNQPIKVIDVLHPLVQGNDPIAMNNFDSAKVSYAYRDRINTDGNSNSCESTFVQKD